MFSRKRDVILAMDSTNYNDNETSSDELCALISVLLLDGTYSKDYS